MLDDYQLVSSQGRAALEPVIADAIIRWRKKVRRGVDDDERARMGQRIAEYSKQVKVNAA